MVDKVFLKNTIFILVILIVRIFMFALLFSVVFSLGVFAANPTINFSKDFYKSSVTNVYKNNTYDVTIKFSASSNIIQLKEGENSLGIIRAFTDNSEASTLYIDCYKSGDSLYFTMDSKTVKEFERKGFNMLLRQYYFNKLIYRLDLDDYKIYIGSYAQNPISDHILRKLGIDRKKEFNDCLQEAFESIHTTEERFIKMTLEQQENFITKNKEISNFIGANPHEKIFLYTMDKMIANNAFEAKYDEYLEKFTHLKRVNIIN